MNVLNETEIVVRDAPVFIIASLMAFSIVMIFFLFAAINKITEGQSSIVIAFYIIVGIYIAYVFITSIVLSDSEKAIQYEVTFDEGYTADAKELLSNYKLTGKRGEIYILQSIETEE